MQWSEVLADSSLQNLPYKIELNENGNIEMSPASFLHSRLQGKIAATLLLQLGGDVFTELAIQTTKGVRVPDVAWGSQTYTLLHQHDVWATSAPEICIEIISPSNNRQAMLDKVTLYLEAGAIEAWLVEEQGQIAIYDRTGKISKSRYTVDLQNCFMGSHS
ncbi:MAG: Uma2 family endonuclease [Methylococcales bacterium]